MTTPLKGLFRVMLKSDPQLRILTGRTRRQTSWLFTKRGEFADHRGQIHSVVRAFRIQIPNTDH